jgi:hypothetical protein
MTTRQAVPKLSFLVSDKRERVDCATAADDRLLPQGALCRAAGTHGTGTLPRTRNARWQPPPDRPHTTAPRTLPQAPHRVDRQPLRRSPRRADKQAPSSNRRTRRSRPTKPASELAVCRVRLARSSLIRTGKRRSASLIISFEFAITLVRSDYVRAMYDQRTGGSHLPAVRRPMGAPAFERLLCRPRRELDDPPAAAPPLPAIPRRTTAASRR